MKNQQNQSDLQTWATAGQSGAKRLLNSFLTTEPERWPHAFLFFGPRGVGKFKLAQEFTYKLGLATGATLEHYEFDFNETNSLDELRELVHLSSLTSADGGKKIFLLRNFQLASTNSLNSLLKTLEEPSPSSMFFLIANSNSTLPTILSRVVPVRCFPVNSSEQVNGLSERVGQSSIGFPELGNLLAANPEFVDQLEILLGELDQSANQARSLVMVSRLNELEADQLQTLLLLWMNRLRLKLTTTVPTIELLNSLRAVQTAIEELGKNFNTKLVLQELLLQTKI